MSTTLAQNVLIPIWHNHTMMNKFYTKTVSTLFLTGIYLSSFGQATLPYTLVFTSDDPAAWGSGIAQDGTGGTQSISGGLHIEIFAANASFNLLSGSTIVWHNNSYLASGNNSYTAITPGPDVTVSNNGVPAMVMKSTNQANNFSLQSITLYDWGGNPTTTIATYDNGVLKGSINVTFDDVNFTTKTISQANALTPALFNNIDEVRFFPNGAPAFWLSFNNIALNNPVILPVSLVYFKGAIQDDNSVQLQWETAQEENAGHFEIEQCDSGQQFTKIGEVAAKGNSALPTKYIFNSNNSKQGLCFYRLKEVDIDGKYEYSDILSLEIPDNGQTLYIYPNPSNGIVHIKGAQGKIREIEVYNTSGALLQSIKNGDSSSTVSLTDLPEGIYYLIFRLDNGIIRKRVIKK